MRRWTWVCRGWGVVFPGGTSGKEPTCQHTRHQRCGFNPWVRNLSWRRAWQPSPVFLPGESHGQRNLVDYGPWGHKELDVTEWLTLTFTLGEKVIICFLNVWSSFELQQVSLLHVMMILFNTNFNASQYTTTQNIFRLLIHLQDKSFWICF